jgi:hypothetical protein
MTRRSHRLQDDLPVFLSLATAIAILVAAAGGIWVWSSILERAAGVTVEKDDGLP